MIMKHSPESSVEAPEIPSVDEGGKEEGPELFSQKLKGIFVRAVTEGIMDSGYDLHDEMQKERGVEFVEQRILEKASKGNLLEAYADGSDLNGAEIRDCMDDGSYYWMHKKDMGREREQGSIVKETVAIESARTHERIFSRIDIENRSSRESICMNDILPDSCFFAPNNDYPMKSYHGADVSNGSFGYVPAQGSAPFNTVLYGDIGSNQGLISLLHEVAHAWQDRCQPSAIHDYLYVQGLLKRTLDVMTLEDALSLNDSDFGNINVALENEILDIVGAPVGTTHEEMKKKARDCIDETSAFLKNSGIEMHAGKVKDITNLHLKVAAKNFIWAERHASSTALKAYRAMKAADLIPDPDETDDILGHIHDGLSSYQQLLPILELEEVGDFTKK